MIAEALAAHAKATARVFDGRENTVGASEVGQCARKVYFSKNSGDHVYGAAADEDYADTWGAALRGRLFEVHFWVPALRARYGDRLLYAGDDQRTLVAGFLSATPDGLLIDQPPDALAALGIEDIGGDGSVVVECKTIDPRSKLDEPKPEHVYQAVVQVGLLRELAPHQPEVALISYANASFLDDISEFAVRFDLAIFANAQRRAAEIVTATAPNELKPEGWITGGKECEFCPFTKACGVIRHAVPVQPPAELPDPQFVAEIADMAREAKGRRGVVEATTADLREIEHDIKERIGLVAQGFMPVKRHELGDLDKACWETDKEGRPRDPWQFTNRLVLHGAEDAEVVFTFATSSRGGLDAVGELCKAYGRHIRQFPDEDPIIELDGSSYPHPDKTIGRVKYPIFKVVGWVKKNAAPTEPPKSPPSDKAAGAAAKPATTHKPAAPHF